MPNKSIDKDAQGRPLGRCFPCAPIRLPVNFTLGGKKLFRAGLPIAFLTTSALFSAGVGHSQQPSERLDSSVDFAQVASEATKAGWEAYDTGSVTAVETLARNIRTLACDRDKDESACEALTGFEKGTVPAFPEGQTALAGGLVIGTTVRVDMFSSCLIKKEKQSSTASCFVIEPMEGMKVEELGPSISGTLAKLASDPTSQLHARLMDAFEQSEFFPLEYSAQGALYRFPGGYRSDRTIPLILRQHNQRLYAATIMFVNRPGSAHSYPTLRLSVMRLPVSN